MPQSIFAQVGQCGNQIGHLFWDLAVQEYNHSKSMIDDSSNFFKFDCDKSGSSVNTMKARAIMIDMEEGVISSILRGHLRDIFDRTQLITDVSGSGNNWAVGNKVYGLKYKERLLELFRKEAEDCDHLQCFFILHSMGGGTGSGLGTAVVEYLSEEFSKVPRFVFAAYPSSQDDVITSPYNTVLANSALIKYADCIIPFENKALLDMCNKYFESYTFNSYFNAVKHATKTKKSMKCSLPTPKKPQAFDEMNSIVANVILNLTCSSRYPGSLNVDINEIVVNMTPYRKLHYLIPNLSPLSGNGKSTIDQLFHDAFSTSNQLFQCSYQGSLLAQAVLCRGEIKLSDIQNNIEKQRRFMKFVPWNKHAWKIGLCDVPQVGHPCSILVLTNTSAVRNPLEKIRNCFMKMYRKKAHLHHFLEVENMELDLIDSSVQELDQVIKEYQSLEHQTSLTELPRLNVIL